MCQSALFSASRMGKSLAKSTKSNNIPDPNPMPIKDGLIIYTFVRIPFNTKFKRRVLGKVINKAMKNLN